MHALLTRIAPPGVRSRRRQHRALTLAAIVGAVTGGVVAVFDELTAEVLLASLLDAPLWAQAAGPLVGLALGAGALRGLAGGATPATADEYIRNVHEPVHPLPLRALPGRLAAAVATLGLGAPLGYEGPAVYAGAGIGTAFQRRFPRVFGSEDAKALMAAGAAAGVAAIFKAPVTGLVFALEVPYRQDLARRMLLPAGIAAATGYVTFAAVAGTEPLLPISGSPPFDLRDIGGAAALGLLAGGWARLASAGVHAAKRLGELGHPLRRAVLAGVMLAGLFVAGRLTGVDNPTLGPGYDTLGWALETGRDLAPLLALMLVRAAATLTALAGGGTGGLFIPLVLQGGLLGQAAAAVVGPSNPTLFPVLGIAAVLGAGYRVPLAAVVFVAEFTGRPGFVVPGLIAAMVAQLPMGDAAVSPYQRSARPGHLERRMGLPITHVLDTAAPTTPPDATLDELLHHLLGARQRSVAVVDRSHYVGIARADDLAGLDRALWPTTPVIDVARTSLPALGLDARVEDAIATMTAEDTDRLAVVDRGRYAGTVSLDDIVRLDDVIDRVRHGTTTR